MERRFRVRLDELLRRALGCDRQEVRRSIGRVRMEKPIENVAQPVARPIRRRIRAPASKVTPPFLLGGPVN